MHMHSHCAAIIKHLSHILFYWEKNLLKYFLAYYLDYVKRVPENYGLSTELGRRCPADESKST